MRAALGLRLCYPKTGEIEPCLNYASNETFAGAIGGNGALVTLGSRMLTLINNETYSGLTTISAGTLVLGNGITSGAVAGNILNNSSLIFNNPVAQSYTGNIRGNGGLVMLVRARWP